MPITQQNFIIRPASAVRWLQKLTTGEGGIHVMCIILDATTAETGLKIKFYCGIGTSLNLHLLFMCGAFIP